MAEKQATNKQTLEFIDARIKVQEDSARHYRTLIADGNRTHSATYTERVRKADAIVRELDTLREFIKTGKIPSILREVPVQSDQRTEATEAASDESAGTEPTA